MMNMTTGCDVQAAPSRLDVASDRQLLERFVARHDQKAFSALVERHGPMVWAVCRRLLRQAEDAEDAFQATFLVLVRRAGSIDRPELLGNWLYGVAYRTACKARAAAARRRVQERQAASMSPENPPPEPCWQELSGVLDAALQGLPEKYRTPLVLCYLQGKTNAEAARLLGWPPGSISARLARGRELLRERLAARGQILPAGTFAAVLAKQVAPAALPAGLADATVRAAMGFLAGKLATVVAPATRVLADEVLAGLQVSYRGARAGLWLLLLAAIVAAGVLSFGVVSGRFSAAFSGHPDPCGTGHHTSPSP
jgi:RNA polymerase sigma-70 factor (ECF subfamily)